MPFITEELWARTSETPRDTLLILADWPDADRGSRAPTQPTAEMYWVIEMIKGIRSVRAEMNVPAGAKIPMVLTSASDSRQRPAGAQSRRDPVPGAADIGRQSPTPFPRARPSSCWKRPWWRCRWAM